MLNRKSMLQDLINKYGVTRDEIVKKVVGDDPKDIEKGLKRLDEIVDYRDVNLDAAKNYAQATGATAEEVAAAVADIEMYRKTIKDDLDKQRNEKIAEATAKIHQEMDAVVKEAIDTQIYGKGAEWKAQRAAEAAAKKEASGKKKAKKDAEAEVVVNTEEETPSGDFSNPFDN